jgi:hypothetical protein
MVKIDVKAFKKEWFSFEEIESVMRWLNDIENGRVSSFEWAKIKAREQIFSKQKVYA